jgi:F-type H+-transporting ATPase subunit a
LLAALEFPPIDHLLEWKSLVLKGTPFALNKTGILCLVAALIVVVLFGVAARRKALVPAGVQNVVEAGVEFVEQGIALSVIGEEGLPWTPLLASLFFFLLFLNLFEILPVIQFPPASRMAIPLYLALQTWVIFIVVGVVTHGPLNYLKGRLFPPGVPTVMYFLLVPIEFLSTFILRPFTLAVRLFANMMAGHMLLTTFYVLTSTLIAAHTAFLKPITVLPFAMAIGVTAFELLVAVLQAYIFTILTAVYIGESMSSEH